MNKLNLKNIIFTVLCFMFFTAYANSPVEQLSQLLKNFETYSADFSQVTLSERGRELQSSTGKMLIKRPGKFRWESEQPTKQVLLTDGKTLWVYDLDLAQVTKQSLATRVTIDPAMLLSGSIKNLDDSFIVSTSELEGKQIFILKPKKADLGFQEVVLTFKQEKLVRMKVVNNLSEITEFSFQNIQINSQLSNALFYFVPIKGVDIIEQ